MKVITYQSDRDQSLNICEGCAKTLSPWPRDQFGAEYCRVSRGLHEGECQTCPEQKMGVIEIRLPLAKKSAYVAAAKPGKLADWCVKQLDKAAGK